jgi:hypothetical protein
MPDAREVQERFTPASALLEASRDEAWSGSSLRKIANRLDRTAREAIEMLRRAEDALRECSKQAKAARGDCTPSGSDENGAPVLFRSQDPEFRRGFDWGAVCAVTRIDRTIAAAGFLHNGLPVPAPSSGAVVDRDACGNCGLPSVMPGTICVQCGTQRPAALTPPPVPGAEGVRDDESWLACTTGDCGHANQIECDAWMEGWRAADADREEWMKRAERLMKAAWYLAQWNDHNFTYDDLRRRKREAEAAAKECEAALDRRALAPPSPAVQQESKEVERGHLPGCVLSGIPIEYASCPCPITPEASAPTDKEQSDG